MQKKMLYLTSRVFWPTKSGHEVHIFNYCRALHEMYGYCIDVYIFEDNKIVESAQNDKPAFIRNVICGNKITKFDAIRNVLGKSIFKKEHWPLQVSLYFNKRNSMKLETLNQQEKYDVLFVDMIRLAPYIQAFSATPELTILDMGDLLSKRYRRQIGNTHSDSSIAGAYTMKLPKVMQAILRSKRLQTVVLKAESCLLERSESEWAEKYDSVILVSPVETDELNKKLKKPKAVTVRVGIDSEYLGENCVREKEIGVLSFVGDLRTPANSDSVHYIISNILPLCKKVRRVEFIGRCPDSLRDAYKRNEILHFAGIVPDVRNEVKSTNVFLAPLCYGTGVKIKIVEAMAMGMPVVTNPIGAEGIPGINGIHWLVGNSDEEIARYVDDLLADDNRCAEIGRNAKRLIEDTFSLYVSAKAFAQAGL